MIIQNGKFLKFQSAVLISTLCLIIPFLPIKGDFSGQGVNPSIFGLGIVGLGSDIAHYRIGRPETLRGVSDAGRNVDKAVVVLTVTNLLDHFEGWRFLPQIAENEPHHAFNADVIEFQSLVNVPAIDYPGVEFLEINFAERIQEVVLFDTMHDGAANIGNPPERRNYDAVN